MLCEKKNRQYDNAVMSYAIDPRHLEPIDQSG